MKIFIYNRYMKNGYFIVFEGIDGSGKGTQLHRLSDWFWDNTFEQVEVGTEPTGDYIGNFIRKALSGEAKIKDNHIMAGLFLADRANHQNVIQRCVHNRTWYLCDRYYYSNMAYNSSDDLTMEEIEEMNSQFRKPDICFYIDIPVDVALDRIGSRLNRDIYESEEYLIKVKNNYEKIIEKCSMIRIDGNRPEEVVFNDILKHVKNLASL